MVVELEHTTAYVVEASDGAVRISLESNFGSFDPWETLELFSSPAMIVNQAPVVEEKLPMAQEVSRRISISFDNTPIYDVLFTFSEFSL